MSLSLALEPRGALLLALAKRGSEDFSWIFLSTTTHPRRVVFILQPCFFVVSCVFFSFLFAVEKYIFLEAAVCMAVSSFDQEIFRHVPRTHGPNPPTSCSSNNNNNRSQSVQTAASCRNGGKNRAREDTALSHLLGKRIRPPCGVFTSSSLLVSENDHANERAYVRTL